MVETSINSWTKSDFVVKIFKTVHSFIRNAWLLNLLTFFSVFFGVQMLHHDLLFKMLGCSPLLHIYC